VDRQNEGFGNEADGTGSYGHPLGGRSRFERWSFLGIRGGAGGGNKCHPLSRGRWGKVDRGKENNIIGQQVKEGGVVGPNQGRSLGGEPAIANIGNGKPVRDKS